IVIAVILYCTVKNLIVSAVFAVIALAAEGALYYLNPSLYDGLISKFFGWFSMITRFENFYAGVFSLADTVYYISFAFIFIYLTVNTIEKRRWS
ncbi:MAG: ABC transporter permease, partial [Clostridiales bacterium]|nr:ABC transporter permease [Clostridiales bacterium]